jgi:RNA polymerase sigma factor (sigma-70 family)
MGDDDLLAERFERNREHLRAVAFRMLGSASEADDAVQEAWFRLSRTDADGIENLGGWLTTVTARVCLDMLRSRTSRREEPFVATAPEPASRETGIDPEEEAVLADSVGLALLVVLETLPPAERLAFVLHDLFAVPFDEIGPIVGRSSTAARQLASRARRRVQGPTEVPDVDQGRQREVVEAFLAASRRGDFDGLLALLDPDVVLHVDRTALRADAALVIRGAEAVAGQAHTYGRRAQHAQAALVNGSVGVIVAPRGRLMLVQTFTVEDGKIVALDLIADPERLDQLELAVLTPR